MQYTPAVVLEEPRGSDGPTGVVNPSLAFLPPQALPPVLHAYQGLPPADEPYPAVDLQDVMNSLASAGYSNGAGDAATDIYV